MNKNRKILSLFTICVIIFLYLPIIIMIIYSFNSSKLMTIFANFSFKWYKYLYHDEEIIKSLLTSLQISFISSTLATTLGIFAAIKLAYQNNKFSSKILQTLILLPFILPEIIIGFTILMLFILTKKLISNFFSLGMLSIIIAHTTVTLSYATLIIYARLNRIDRSLEEAAADLGAKPWTVLTKITIPSIMPAIISSWLLTFILSLDDLVIASFTAGQGIITLPMLIHSKLRIGITPEINALASMIILIVFTLSIAVLTINQFNSKRKIK